MSLQKIMDLKSALAVTIRREGADLLKSQFSSVFEAIPRLQGIRWTQGTPTYNDGNPCVFRVSDIYYSVADLENYGYKYVSFGVYDSSEEFPYTGNYDDEFLELDCIQDKYHDCCRMVNPITEDEAGVLEMLNALLHANKDVLKFLFGDPETITAYRDGRIDIQDAFDRID